jgi:hypothetical protein
MFDDIISRIKEKQERKDKVEQELLPEIINFHRILVESLKSLIELAKDMEIRGVEFQDKIEYQNGVVEFLFRMNGSDYILVTNKHIERLNFRNENIGNHSFVFRKGDDNSLPILQITVLKSSNTLKYYSVSWFGDEEKHHITGNKILENDSGKDAALEIINFIYDLKFRLKDCPTLEAFHSESPKNHKFGFLE